MKGQNQPYSTDTNNYSDDGIITHDENNTQYHPVNSSDTVEMDELDKHYSQMKDNNRNNLLNPTPDDQSDKESNKTAPIKEKEEKVNADKPKQSTNEKIVTPDYEKELKTTKDRLHENQRYGRSLTQNRNKAISTVEQYLQDGDLSDEQAQTLLSILKSNSSEEPEGLSKIVSPSHSTDPFEKFINIANREVLENYLDVTEDDNYQEKIVAYDNFLKEATDEERQNLYNELTQLEKSPMKVLKKMLSKGQEFLDEGYNEFSSAGGIRKYLQSKKNETQVLNKKIEKLEKELLEYKQFDQPNYSIPVSNPQSSDNSQYSDELDRYYAQKKADYKNRR